MTMNGLVIPSRMQQEEFQRAKNLRELSGFGNAPEKLVYVGNGMAINQAGQCVLLSDTKENAPASQMEAEDLVERIMKELERRNIAPTPQQMRSLQTRATDPLIAGTPPYRANDFTLEFGVPVDTTEIMALCEEISLYDGLPEVINGANTDSWLEMNALYFTGGQNFVAFGNGECPEEYTSNTVNRTVAKKHLGAKRTLSQSDIVHSMASIAAGYGVSALVGPTAAWDSPNTFMRSAVGDAKEKEIRRAMTLTLNGWDELLVKGSVSNNAEEFDGIETIITTGNGARANFDNAVYSGTFSAARFDEWIAAGCARPTHIFGHPTALQALKMGYWGLGANSGPAQIVTNGSNGAIRAGLTFVDVIQTAIGPITLIGDTRFSRTDHGDGTFSSNLYPIRMVHNGEPLLYKATQIPLNFKDLAPGCTAISFMTWAVSALTIKHMCAQGVYRSRFAGIVDDSCGYVHPDSNPAFG